MGDYISYYLSSLGLTILFYLDKSTKKLLDAIFNN